MPNYKIYSPNNNHSCDYGVDFVNGVALTADENAVKWFRDKGYYVERTSDTALNSIDTLPVDVIQSILSKYSVALNTASASIKIEKRELALALDYCLSTAVAASGNIGATTFKSVVSVTYAKAGAEVGSVPTESATGLGTIVTVKASALTPPSGKVFSHWVDGAGNTYIAGDKLRLGASPLTLTAVYVDEA